MRRRVTQNQKLKTAIDYTMLLLRMPSSDRDREKWIAYLMESIESDLGIEALEQIEDMIRDRRQAGGW